jgi:hypothetical protein
VLDVPLAHAGHVIVDVILILVPLLAMGVALAIANLRQKRERE